MEGWLLDAICADMGQQVVDRIRHLYETRTTIHHVPFVVLVRILSLVDREDIFNVVRVCKDWHRASQERAFWQRHQHEMVMSLITSMEKKYQLCLTRSFLREALYYFDFFVFKEYGPRIFFGNSKCASRAVYYHQGELWISLTANVSDSHKVRLQILFDDKNQWVACSEESWRFGSANVIDGLRTTRFLGGEVSSCVYATNRIYKRGEYVRNFDNVFIFPNGDRFDGEFFKDEEIPHGKGKWTFADGTTLTGDKVAFDGLPHGQGQEGEQGYFAGEPLQKRIKL